MSNELPEQTYEQGPFIDWFEADGAVTVTHEGVLRLGDTDTRYVTLSDGRRCVDIASLTEWLQVVMSG